MFRSFAPSLGAMETVTLDSIRAARDRIRGVALETPLIPSPHFSTLAGSEVLLKLETMQPTSAFKLRGATNAMANLPDGVKGVTCCSTGNHGRGVAYAARRLGVRAVICMSELVPSVKVDGIRALGAEVRIVGRSQDDAQAEAERLVAEEGLTEISPFHDPFVVSGQGTISLEMLEARPDIETILIPLSGGGLAGGVALAAKSLKPTIRLIGLTMERGAAMHASIRAGHPVEVEEVPSLADSLGGGIMPDNWLTLGLCTDYLDDTLLVSEEEIYTAMQTLFYEDRLVAEGASCVGLAAMLAGKLPDLKGPVGVIVTGRNVDPFMFADIVAGRDLDLGGTKVKGHAYPRP